MKRYDGYILRFINHEGGARQQEPAEVYLASEVDAERAKDRKNYEDALTDMVKEKNEEIARLRKALECIRTEIKGKYTLTGLFDLIENLAREALEGE